MTDPSPLTPAELDQRNAGHIAELTAFWQRVTDDEAAESTRETERGRRAKYEAACNRPGLSVWQVDESGVVIAKFASGSDAGERCRIHINTVNLSIREGRALGDGRKFIRLPANAGEPANVGKAYVSEQGRNDR